MILGVYATLGIFLLIASRHPAENRSLILFTAWSSLVHAAIMAAQAMANTAEHGHLLGDVPALIVVGMALIALAPLSPYGNSGLVTSNSGAAAGKSHHRGATGSSLNTGAGPPRLERWITPR